MNFECLSVVAPTTLSLNVREILGFRATGVLSADRETGVQTVQVRDVPDEH
jgi:hypothetical protein